jgi:hypothetical protein
MNQRHRPCSPHIQLPGRRRATATGQPIRQILKVRVKFEKQLCLSGFNTITISLLGLANISPTPSNGSPTYITHMPAQYVPGTSQSDLYQPASHQIYTSTPHQIYHPSSPSQLYGNVLNPSSLTNLSYPSWHSGPTDYVFQSTYHYQTPEYIPMVGADLRLI